MKKVLSIVLALVIVLSLGVVALAADATATKTYKLDSGTTNSNSPAETFTFTTPVCTSVEDGGTLASGSVVTTSTAPAITVSSVEYDAGAATTDGTAKTITIGIPTYEAVGIYTYTFKEVDNKTAGVTYFANDITVVVTVAQDATGFPTVVAVHCESPVQAIYKDDKGNTYSDEALTTPISAENIKKTDQFENTYSSGDLSVKKQVEGLLADQSKEFAITVTFNAPAGKTVRSAITYTPVGGTEQTISFNESGVGTATINLKHDATVLFKNIPDGVTYTVTEADYSADGYEAPSGTVTSATAITAGSQTDVVITNKKDATPDTGITLDSLPYVLMAVMAMFAAVVIILNKRRASDY